MISMRIQKKASIRQKKSPWKEIPSRLEAEKIFQGDISEYTENEIRKRLRKAHPDSSGFCYSAVSDAAAED